MKRVRRPTAWIVTVAFVCSICGCWAVKEPALVYSYVDPDLAVPTGEVLPVVEAGDPVRVILLDGSSFDAIFEGEQDSELSFSDIEWETLSTDDQTLAFNVDRTSTCALRDVSEVYLRNESSTADAVMGWGSLVVLVLLFGAFAYGQGGGD